MDMDALRNANFSKLSEAITDWDQMVKKLKHLKGDADSDLRGKARKADWSGQNSKVTRKFIDKTAREFGDAHTHAQTVHRILSDTHDELVSYRGQLRNAISSADKKGIKVEDTGEGNFKVRKKDEDNDEVTQDELTGVRDQISHIMKKASHSDFSAAEALRSYADMSKYGFNSSGYKDRDEAAKALKEAKRAATLAKDPANLSREEFYELNKIFKKNHNDKLFSERFATQLGAKGTLEFWQGVNGRGNRELLETGKDHFDDMQKNFSMTLASATQSDSPAMQHWEQQVVSRGPKLVGGETPSHTGFQVMSSLMHYGDYDDKFLNKYGNDLISEEKRRSGNGKDPRWSMASGPQINYAGSDDGRDPMNGYMKALAHSPDAATEFFNDDYVTKNEDSEFEDENGNKLDKTNFQYLFDEREWLEDGNDDAGEHAHPGRNALGEALEAATTGHPAGEHPTPDLPPHNAGQAKLYEDIVGSVADNDKRLTEHKYMADSLGRISGEYMPDIHRSLADDPYGNTNKLYPVAGAQAKMDHQDVTRFLVSVGQDPKGYAAIYAGQQGYAANLMDYQLDPDTPKDERYPGSHSAAVEAISRSSGEIGGTLAIGRQEAVLGNAETDDESFSHAMSQSKNVVSGAIGTGVGIGTSFIASPIAGAAVGEGAGTVSSVVLDEIFGAEPDSKEAAAQPAGAKWEKGLEGNVTSHQRAAILAAKAHDIPGRISAPDWARKGTVDGFNTAEANVNKMGMDLETDV